MTADSLLQVSDLQTWFDTPEGTVRAVDGVSFEIRRGETFALLGESGSGKSITALSLLRLVPEPAGRIVSGTMRLEGQDLLALPERKMRAIRGKRMAMIFQEPQSSLNPVLTIGYQIGEALRGGRVMKAAERRERVVELLRAVGIADPARRHDEYPHQLSGGMKQRAMIAMALAGEPALLIADEPTTALDVTIQAQILDLLKEQQRRTGMAILLITHDLGVVGQVADRVAVMYAGQIVEQAAREQLFRSPRHPYTRKLFDAIPTREKRLARLNLIPGQVPNLRETLPGCRFAERCDQALPICTERAPAWIGDTGGQGVRCHLYTTGAPAAIRAAAPAVSARATEQARSADALLEVRDLKVHFPIRKGVFKRTVGYVKAVDGVSLDIPPGRTLALVGESGSGKTTVGKGILQLIPPNGGTVQFQGQNLVGLPDRSLRPLRRHFQIIFQDPYSSLDPRMLVGDILEEGMRAQGIGRDREERRARVETLLQQVGLPAQARNRYPHEFSGGQRQRISIARALAMEPRLIVCDEPTSALDVSVQAQILNLLIELQERLGLSYLFITHNMSVVEYMAHEVAIMYLGRIVESGQVDEILQHPKHPYTQALLAAVPKIEDAGTRPALHLGGDMPSPSHPPRGCHFHPRCPQAMEVCKEIYPEASGDSRHTVCCHLHTGEVGRRAGRRL